MFIGICGSICAGKTTIAQYLVDHHGFTRLHLGSSTGGEGTHAPPSKEAAAAAAGPVSSKANGGGEEEVFATADELLDLVTARWRDRWVTTDIPSEAVLDMYSRRPFFLLVSVDAPVGLRWRRFQGREEQRRRRLDNDTAVASRDDMPLADFVALSDAYLYDAATGQLPLMSRAGVRLLNTSGSVAQLFGTLGALDLLDEDRLRPSWDSYFMALASLAAQRSNCMKRRVGCVVVRDKRVISTGYNGTPRGLLNCGEGGCGRCNDASAHRSGHGLATCLCIHAEENALLEAGRERVGGGAVLYCDTCPCLTCSIKIAQVGINEVVYSQGYSMDSATAAVFLQAGVRLRQLVPPASGLIHLEKTELYK
ncbi:cytidine deaminase-like protein [Lasiosphaeria miniovina]|uniref:Deoxycytidylate deaminase n=1 Tax=Lasiosphaeria miniovina TaxID=1954250 RepID=A0AA40EAS8_9PEZI|nr:cytidine deaminase-like protein [Lasiosphaeria miniovina]KAK0728643.1 cytidine deaminase-like protein [Lasiosphaeria miniovina]